MKNSKCFIYDINSEYIAKDEKELKKDAMILIIMSGFTENFEVIDACVSFYKEKKVMVVKVREAID